MYLIYLYQLLSLSCKLRGRKILIYKIHENWHTLAMPGDGVNENFTLKRSSLLDPCCSLAREAQDKGQKGIHHLGPPLCRPLYSRLRSRQTCWGPAVTASAIVPGMSLGPLDWAAHKETLPTKLWRLWAASTWLPWEKWFVSAVSWVLRRMLSTSLPRLMKKVIQNP